MKKLIYFHGLQSKQGGQKIDYLTRSFLVHAPQMKYKQQKTWQETAKKIQKIQPDLILGSSMGGLMSFYAGYKLDCKMLLFNPAFDRIPEYIDGWKCYSQDQKAQIEIVLGRNDTDVDPKKSLEYLQANQIRANVTMLDIQHRVPYDVFVQETQRFLGKIYQS